VIASLFDELDLTNAILILGVVAVIVKTVGEGRGWFRSAAALRVENTDLLRRNDELQAAVARHEITLAANDVRILALEQTIRELEKLDQSAVLEQLRAHEIGAIGRAQQTHALQVETNASLERIATILETPTEGAPA
jgi:hypothetical protein